MTVLGLSASKMTLFFFNNLCVGFLLVHALDTALQTRTHTQRAVVAMLVAVAVAVPRRGGGRGGGDGGTAAGWCGSVGFVFVWVHISNSLFCFTFWIHTLNVGF